VAFFAFAAPAVFALPAAAFSFGFSSPPLLFLTPVFALGFGFSFFSTSSSSSAASSFSASACLDGVASSAPAFSSSFFFLDEDLGVGVPFFGSFLEPGEFS
jgi:hypothetical protein